MTPLKALECVEAALGENLVWLADELDQKIRQKDPDTLRRMDQLSSAWKAACVAIAELKRAA